MIKILLMLIILLAMCYYETIEGEKKDLAPLILSKKELNLL